MNVLMHSIRQIKKFICLSGRFIVCVIFHFLIYLFIFVNIITTDKQVR